MLRDMPNFYRLRPSYKIELENIGKMHVCSKMRKINKTSKTEVLQTPSAIEVNLCQEVE